MVSQGNFALAGAIPPADSYGRRAAARSEAMQLQSAITQQQEIQLTQEQQAAAQVEQQLLSLKSIPFEGADKAKLAEFFRGAEKQAFKRLANYNGNLKQWYAAEGAAWQQQLATSLQNSPFYAQAVQNRMNIDAARKAIEKGEYVVGGQQGNSYITGETALSEFLAGKREKFDFYGSYKPEDDLKPLRETYAPGKMPWEVTPVSEEAKQAHLVNAYGKQVGLDKYIRQHQNVPTLYKYDALDKKAEFDMKLEDQQMQRDRLGLEKGRYGMASEMHGLNKAYRALQIADKANELNGGKDAQGRSFIEQEAANSPINKTLSIPKVGNLSGFPLYGTEVENMATFMGLQKTKEGTYNGRLGKVITLKGDTVDLSGMKDLVITSIDPTQYHAGMGPNGKPGPNGLQGFARVTVKFKNTNQPESQGLYSPSWYLPESLDKELGESEKGVGVYDPYTMEATFIVPTGAIDSRSNRSYNGVQQKARQGQKRANEDYDAPYLFDPNSF